MTRRMAAFAGAVGGRGAATDDTGSPVTWGEHATDQQDDAAPAA
jgi:hypothetical protein